MSNILSNPSIAVPASPDEITPAFLTGVLRTAGFLHETSVKTVEVLDRSLGKGLTAQISRVGLTYDGPAPDAPCTAIVKLSTANAEMRQFINRMGFYEREVRFYVVLGGKMTFRIPRCYTAAFDAGSGMHLLILEDLTGLENGNSVAGCSADRAESIVRMLARFHAAWWNNPLLANLDWLNQTNNPGDQTRERMLLRYWEGLCQAIGDDKMPAIDAITARLSGYWSVMTTRMDRSPLTLVHGDFQLSNLFFDPQRSEADPIVTDFQGVSFSRAAAYDLGFFMGHSLDSQVRRAHEARLLSAYYTTLLNNGVQDYPYAEFLDDYRFGILTCMIRLSFMIGGELIKDRNVFMARVQRYCAAIEDNQAWKVLEMREGST